jgi:hypothetical protein
MALRPTLTYHDPEQIESQRALSTSNARPYRRTGTDAREIRVLMLNH